MNIKALKSGAAQISDEEILTVVESEAGSPGAYYLYKEPGDLIGVVHYFGSDGTPMQRWEDDMVFAYALATFLTKSKAPIFECMSDLVKYEKEITANRKR